MNNQGKKTLLASALLAGMLLYSVPSLADKNTTAPATDNVTTIPIQETSGATAADTLTAVPAQKTSAGAPAETASGSAADTQRLDASYTLALNAINKEDYETAKQYLDICFVYCDPQSDPVMYADLLLKRACINVIEEKNDMALLNLDAALKVQPDLADAYLIRTQIYSSNGDFGSAVENLEKYIELTKDETMYETLAQIHEASGNAAAAEEAYDKYAAVAGSEKPETGFQSGLYKMQNGKLEEAIKAFEAYVNDETYGAGAQYNIAICKMNLGDNAGAIEAFNACEEKGGTFTGLWYNRGTCYFLNEDWAKSSEDFTRSIENEQFVEESRYNLAICNMQKGEYEAAVTVFDEMIKNVESSEGTTLNDSVYYFRAVCNEALGKYEDAIKDLTTCIDHGYELSQTYYERAQVYAAMGDTEKQSSDLEQSLKYTK